MQEFAKQVHSLPKRNGNALCNIYVTRDNGSAYLKGMETQEYNRMQEFAKQVHSLPKRNGNAGCANIYVTRDNGSQPT